jgi:hypothetical protein
MDIENVKVYFRHSFAEKCIKGRFLISLDGFVFIESHGKKYGIPRESVLIIEEDLDDNE